MDNWFPNLVGKIDPEAERAITALFTKVYTNQTTLDSVKKVAEAVSNPDAPPAPVLHPADRAFISTNLQANGTHPLNVTNLLGQLAQPQMAKAPVSTSGNGSGVIVAPGSPPVAGQFQIVDGQLFYFDTSTLPGSWVEISADATILTDTRANRLANYSPSNFPLDKLFWESDTDLMYINRRPTGTVNVSGTAVTWVSGDFFDTTGTWTTLTMNINGVAYQIASVATPTSLTLSSSAGTASGETWQIPDLFWFYMFGTAPLPQASLSGFFSTYDTGAKVDVTDYNHILFWDGSAYHRYGSDSEHSDTFHFFGAAPSDVGWHACDGSTISYLKYDGTLGSRILPNLSTSAYLNAGNTYTPALVAPVLPVFTGTPAPSGLDVTTIVGTANVVQFPYTPAGTIALPGDPIENFLAILWYRQ